MSDNEVNKIIAEFMCIKPFIVDNEALYDIPCLSCAGHDEYGTTYTRSLDALVPVWEKLNFRTLDLYKDKSADIFVAINKSSVDYIYESVESMRTIQVAAAHATARAILELNRQNLP